MAGSLHQENIRVFAVDLFQKGQFFESVLGFPFVDKVLGIADADRECGGVNGHGMFDGYMGIFVIAFIHQVVNDPLKFYHVEIAESAFPERIPEPVIGCLGILFVIIFAVVVAHF